MEATEIAEQIHEAHGHEAHGAPASSHAAHENFRKMVGIYLGVVAMLLAIATLGGSHATKEMLSANIHASDTYNFYQAKYIRQLSYQIAADELEAAAATSGAAAPTPRAAELIKKYRDTATRYETEPATGDGKKELMAKAKEWEHERDHAYAQDPNFEFAEALFQIAVVLGSVSIVAASPPLLGVSAAIAVVAALLTINGYFLLAPFPLG